MLDDAQTLLAPFWETMLGSRSLYMQRAPVPLHEHPLTMGNYSADKEQGHSKGVEKEGGDDVTSKKISARTHGPGFMVLASYWAKVNNALLERHPHEMLAFVKTMPNVVEGITKHFDTPAMVELLYRLIQCEDTVPDSGIVAWLSENGLIPRIVALLNPYASIDSHKAASEFLKTIISLSAPSPSSLNQVTIQDTFGGPGEMLIGAGGVNNLLVRELASRENVDKMVSFMLDYELGSFSKRENVLQDSTRRTETLLQTLQEDSAVDEDEEEQDVWEFQQAMKNLQNRHLSTSRSLSTAGMSVRDSTATIRPSTLRRSSSVRRPLTAQALTSSFINCAGVCIELIRKNNSDYFEQHLFHTLRNYLVIRHQEISSQHKQDRAVASAAAAANDAQKSGDANTDDKPELSLEDLQLEDDADTEGLDEAMDEVAEKMGIVHLGPLLHALADRIPDLQEKMRHPIESANKVRISLGEIEPLTQTRYCIAELYAEMLHCSNMALLNRPLNSGPKYSASGTLLGGLEGLHALARTLQGEDDLDQNNSGMSASAEWAPDDPHDEAPGSGSSSPGQSTGESAAESAASDGAGPGQNAGALSSSDTDEDDKNDDDDAESIASALSSMSLADMISQFARPRSTEQESDVHIVGNFLKTQFQSFQVIPTLIELLLAFPWNNFLHNVVYDIIQQLFNGDLDISINRKLIISVFKDAHLVESILEGARRNRASTESPRRVRLGYMGHLNLIAEEIVKLLERYPMEIGNFVQDHFTPEWDQFLKEELSASRAKESMPLAGGRPSASSMGMQNWSSLESDNWYSDGDNNHTFAEYLSSQMRSDEDGNDVDGDNLAFINSADPMLLAGEQDPDDWGPFADSRSAFEFTSTASINPPERQENLTPADWAAEFRRTSMGNVLSNSTVDNDSDSDDMPTTSDIAGVPADDSDENADDDSPYVDLHKPAALRQQTMERTQPDRVSEDGESGEDEQEWPAAYAARHVRTMSNGGEDKAPVLAAEQLDETVEPTEDGLIQRTLDDGTVVKVPLDDAELAESNQRETGAS